MNPAFAYFYDDFVSDKKYEKELNEIEAEIANKNIGGRIARLSMFRNPREMIEDLLLGGAENIIVVGDDDTLKKVVWSSQDLNAVFGYVPIGRSTEIAGLLGIQPGKTAVDILAGRYIEKLDVGRVGDGLFIKEIFIRHPDARVIIENRFDIRPMDQGMMIIRNVSLPDVRAPESPALSALEIEVLPRLEETRREKRENASVRTRLRFTRARIVAEKEMEIKVDGQGMFGSAFDVELIPKRLQCITGRRFIGRVSEEKES